MKVSRVERHIINKNHKMYKVIDEYCYKSKNLYNYANYTIRQSYINEGKYIQYNDMWKLVMNDDPFKEIGSNSGQHTLKMLDKAWKSFFEGIKGYKKNPSKYLGRPKIPKYLKKDGRYVWVLTNIQSKIVDGFLKFSFKPLKPYNNLIRTNVKYKHMQTRIVPKGDHYVLEIVYDVNVPEMGTVPKRIIGIDLGVNRFATIQNNIGLKPIAINGGKVKSINNYYNKQVAKYMSSSKKVNKLDWTKRLQKLTTKRGNKVELFIHEASKYIVDYCLNNKIDTVVIGYNSTWKQNIKMGKTTQQFVGIPFLNFVSKLEYKLQNNGIRLIKTEESYTSKASFIDNDEMIKGVKFSGKRVHRGLYETNNGHLINADVNGASNIIRKVFPNAFGDGIKGVDFHPSIVNL